MFVKHCKVEVYLLELNLCENDNMDNVVTRHFSKADTIGKGLCGFSFALKPDKCPSSPWNYLYVVRH